MIREKVHINKQRGLPGVSITALRYIVHYSGSLYLPLLVLALPIIAAALVTATLITGTATTLPNIFTHYGNISDDSFTVLIAAAIAYIAGVGLHNTVVSKHLLESEKAEENATPPLRSITANLSEDFRHLLLNFVIFASLLAGLFLLYGFIFGVNISPGSLYANSATAYIGMVSEILAQFLPFIIAYPFVQFFLIATLFVCHRDKLGFMDAVKKVWYYVNGNFLSTWVLSTVFIILTYLLTMGTRYLLLLLLALPRIISSGTLFDPWVMTMVDYMPVMSVVFALITFLVAPYYQVVVILHYGSLEEKREGTELKKRIEST